MLLTHQRMDIRHLWLLGTNNANIKSPKLFCYFFLTEISWPFFQSRIFTCRFAEQAFYFATWAKSIVIFFWQNFLQSAPIKTWFRIICDRGGHSCKVTSVMTEGESGLFFFFFCMESNMLRNWEMWRGWLGHRPWTQKKHNPITFALYPTLTLFTVRHAQYTWTCPAGASIWIWYLFKVLFINQ